MTVSFQYHNISCNLKPKCLHYDQLLRCDAILLPNYQATDPWLKFRPKSRSALLRRQSATLPDGLDRRRSCTTAVLHSRSQTFFLQKKKGKMHHQRALWRSVRCRITLKIGLFSALMNWFHFLASDCTVVQTVFLPICFPILPRR